MRSQTRSQDHDFLKDERGVAAIEFAILAAPFFALMFMLIETAMIFAGEIVLDRGVEIVGRQVRTGELDKAEMNAERFRTKLCEQVDYLLSCDKLKIDLATYDRFADIEVLPPTKDGAFDYSGFGYTRGGPQQVTALRAVYEWPVHVDVVKRFMGDANGNFVILAMTAFMTESYR